MYLGKENRCFHVICHDSIAIYNLSMYAVAVEWIASWIVHHFFWGATKWQTKATLTLKQTNGIHGAIFTFTYHKVLNPGPNSSASPVVNYSWLSACQREMEPFKDHLSTHGQLTNLRNKPQQIQPGQLSAPIPIWNVSYCI